jgi:hypothetical protein
MSKVAKGGRGHPAFNPRTREPTWERTPKWHWRCWLRRQTWCYYQWGGVTRYYKTEVQMAKHNLALRYDPNLQGGMGQTGPIRDLGAAMGMKPIGGRRARV